MYIATCFRVLGSSVVSRAQNNCSLLGILTGLGHECSISTLSWLQSGHWVMKCNAQLGRTLQCLQNRSLAGIFLGLAFRPLSISGLFAPLLICVSGLAVYISL